jgi:hypothetical protein
MSTLREAAQQALEALEKSRVFVTTREKIKHPEGTEWYDGTITALRAALAQQQEQEQEQEADYPEEKLQAVAEYISDKYHVWYGVGARDVEEVLRQSVSCGLVSGAPRREWVSLTDDEISALFPSSLRSDYKPYSFARAVEQACKERNT